MSKLLVINGSYRINGYTATALRVESDSIRKKYNIDDVEYIFINDGISACNFCETCQFGCRIKDQFQTIVNAIIESERILIGSPVYLDFPSPKLLAFLSRFGFMTEKDDRRIPEGKKVHILACGYCSGTKTVIHSLMGALEMCGFTIEGRSTKEYIALWKDGKIRGGMRKEDSSWIPKEIIQKLHP